MSTQQGIDPINLCVTPIFPLIHGRAPRPSSLGSATGFFYRHEGKHYLITNRYVVVDEKDDYYPDSLIIKLHVDVKNLQQIRDVEIPLYEDERLLWYEHPNLEYVDIIAYNLDEYILEGDRLHYISLRNIDARAGPYVEDLETIYLIGYPLGFYDTRNNLPIKRGCTLASPYGNDFEGNPYFLVDARIHSGLSGSPVFTPMFISENGEPLKMAINSFLGIFSGEYIVKGINLGLGVVWYPVLVHEIVANEREGRLL